jgi:hypothetical protein
MFRDQRFELCFSSSGRVAAPTNRGIVESVGIEPDLSLFARETRHLGTCDTMDRSKRTSGLFSSNAIMNAPGPLQSWCSRTFPGKPVVLRRASRIRTHIFRVGAGNSYL